MYKGTARRSFCHFLRKSLAKYRTLIEFLRSGLERGEGAIYVTFSEPKSRILKAMKRFGVDTEGYTRNSRLAIVTVTQSVARNSKGVMRRQQDLTLLKDACSGVSRDSGVLSLRIALSASERLKNMWRPSDVPHVEEAIDSLAAEQPVAIMCAYDSRTLKSPSWFKAFPFLTRIHLKAAFISRKGSIIMEGLKGGRDAISEQEEYSDDLGSAKSLGRTLQELDSGHR